MIMSCEDCLSKRVCSYKMVLEELGSKQNEEFNDDIMIVCCAKTTEKNIEEKLFDEHMKEVAEEYDKRELDNEYEDVMPF